MAPMGEQYHKSLCLEVGFARQIVSFKPIPELTARLRVRSANDPLRTVRACAQGAAPGELILNVAGTTAFSPPT